MVKIVSHPAGEAYTCEECSLKYKDKTLAEQCEAWCREHKSCNLGIIQHAIPEEPARKDNKKE